MKTLGTKNMLLQICKWILGVKDYVVESGTDANGWDYEKWNSGKMTAWRSFSTGTVSGTASNFPAGSYFYQLEIQKPVGMLRNARLTGTAGGWRGNGLSWVQIINVGIPNVDTLIFRWINNTQSANGYGYVHLIGEWKALGGAVRKLISLLTPSERRCWAC